MDNPPTYLEKVTSRKTFLLFLALAVLCGVLFLGRLIAVRLDWLAVLLMLLSLIFLFYTLNYRVLDIQLDEEKLQLTFGLFTWRVPLSNIKEIQPDDQLPWLVRNGGAGVHFMVVHGRYRASFNFLEHPRVVITFKHKVGPVRELSFSTRQPVLLIKHLSQVLDQYDRGKA